MMDLILHSFLSFWQKHSCLIHDSLIHQTNYKLFVFFSAVSIIALIIYIYISQIRKQDQVIHSESSSMRRGIKKNLPLNIQNKSNEYLMRQKQQRETAEKPTLKLKLQEERTRCKKAGKIYLTNSQYYNKTDTIDKQRESEKNNEKQKIRKRSLACGHYWKQSIADSQVQNSLISIPFQRIGQKNRSQHQYQVSFRNDYYSGNSLGKKCIVYGAMRPKDKRHIRKRSSSENNININIFGSRKHQSANSQFNQKSNIEYVVMHLNSHRNRKDKRDIIIDLNYGIKIQTRLNKKKKNTQNPQQIIKQTKKSIKQCRQNSKKSKRSITVCTSTFDLQNWANTSTPKKQSLVGTENTLNSYNLLNYLQNGEGSQKFKNKMTCLSQEDLLQQVKFLRNLSLRLYNQKNQYLAQFQKHNFKFNSQTYNNLK